MKVVKTLLTLVLVVGVLGGAAYGAGRLLADNGSQHPVASSTDLPRSPTTSSPSTPSSSPTSPTSPAWCGGPLRRRAPGRRCVSRCPAGRRCS
jgi:hypothetical protein